MTPSQYPFVLAAALALLFVGYGALTWRFAPWRRLAQRYPAPAKFRGETMFGCQVQGGSALNPEMLTVGGNSEGIYLRPFLSMTHGAVLVPWADAEFSEPFRRYLNNPMEELVELVLGTEDPVRVQLGRYTAEWLRSLEGRSPT